MPDPAACAVKYTMHSVVCDKEDQVMIMGSDMTVCGMFKGREVVVPAGEEMGLLVMPGNKEQDGGVTSYRVEYSLIHDCSDLSSYSNTG